MSAIGPASEIPHRAARPDPAASITARISSMRSSTVGTDSKGSERPVPRLSQMTSRAYEAIHSISLGTTGISQ